MFDALISLLAKPLTLFYNFTGNYVIALILYGVLIKLLLFPFGIKQQKGMVRQAQMRPKEMAIRKRYAGRTDQKTQMKMQEDLQKLYQEEGYNPLSGCGPMLIQMPIILILYRIVYEPLRYVAGHSKELCTAFAEKAGEIAGVKFAANNHIPFLEVIRDNIAEFPELIAEDFDKFFESFHLFGINLTMAPNTALSAISAEGAKDWAQIITLLSIPVLVFLAQWGSMKVIRKFSYQPIQDPSQSSSMKIMDFVMPLMTLFFAFNFSGLLGIYWILNSLLSMVQQIVLKAMYPTPVFTEEDYRAAEKAMNGKHKPAKKPAGEKKRNPKSLHHIDDDEDEDEIAEPAPKKEKTKANPFIEPAKEKTSDDEEGNDK